MKKLGFGIFLAPFHTVDEDPTAALDRDMGLVEHLDRLGYDEAWIGEHHSGGYEIIAAPDLFIAAAAERTKHIRLGTGVSSLPYHHPFTNAGRMVQLDHMTKGRAMFGVGPGALVGDAFRMGIDPDNQRRMMNEALDAIVPMLDGETVNMKTDWFELRDAQMQLPCYTRPRIEMAVACARSPAGALAAGRHGLGMLSIGGTSDEALAAHSANWRLCEETAAAAGHTVSRDKWRVVSLAHVARSREQAKKNVEYGLENFAQYFRDIATFPIVPPEIDDAYEYLTESGMAVIGDPDDAIRHIEKLLKGSGGFGLFLELAHNWADYEATLEHFELMARYVVPHFNGKNDQRRNSYEYSHRNREVFVGAAQAAVAHEIDRHETEGGKAQAGDD
ncbi:MAG: LLM class flavin-dependent oxidoreductase [Alphaproteobacteria bacterium]|nr:LLM class flavin-dependent oxidoreductase [Alphaproteobacteria bacterium]